MSTCVSVCIPIPDLLSIITGVASLQPDPPTKLRNSLLGPGPACRWRTSLGYMHGRWGLPLPHAIPIFLVHGKPVPVPKVDRSDTVAFEKAVDVLHQGVVEELQAMYDR